MAEQYCMSTVIENIKKLFKKKTKEMIGLEWFYLSYKRQKTFHFMNLKIEDFFKIDFFYM